jgi:hypothetical protein
MSSNTMFIYLPMRMYEMTANNTIALDIRDRIRVAFTKVVEYFWPDRYLAAIFTF